jgi:hypothetical protein
LSSETKSRSHAGSKAPATAHPKRNVRWQQFHDDGPNKVNSCLI